MLVADARSFSACICRGRLPRPAPLLFLLPVLLCGCGGGGGGGGGGIQTGINGVASDVTTSDLGSNRIEVRFRLSASTAKSLGVSVTYSENRGISYTSATLETAPAQPGALPADSSGITHSLVWRLSTDVQTMSQHDLRMRVTPYDTGSGGQGVACDSAVFGVGSNTVPQVSGVSTPTGTQGGWVSFQYTVADADGDYVGLEGEFSLNGGSTWDTATLGSGDGVSALSAPSGGTTHTISWNSQEDVTSTATSNVLVRLRGVDTSPGTFVSSGAFSIDTRGPVISLLTIDGIPANMNGSLAYLDTSNQSQTFTLLAPPEGFVVTVNFTAGAQAVNATSLSVSADRALGAGGVGSGAAAGQSFGSSFSVDTGAGVARLTIPSSLEFPQGEVTLTATIADALGNASAAATYVFETGPASADRRPFESTERWHLDFTRDNYTTTSTIDGMGTVTITATASSNGVADFVEDLRILGLQSASPPAPAVSANLNGLVLDAVKTAVIGFLSQLYGRNFDGSSAGSDSVAIQFLLTAPSGSFSRMGIGGDDPVPGFTIGRAEFDYRNSLPNNNSDADLGVFSTNLIDFYINSSFAFKGRFDPLIPGRGTALGFDASDVTVLSPGFDRSDPGNSAAENQRFDDIDNAIDGIGRTIAVILAHEIGHSLGLVANGAPPAGLFGGEFRASFSGPYTSAYHLDTSANDIMASSLSFTGAIATGGSGPRFTELILAYLQERVLLD